MTLLRDIPTFTHYTFDKFKAVGDIFKRAVLSIDGKIDFFELLYETGFDSQFKLFTDNDLVKIEFYEIKRSSKYNVKYPCYLYVQASSFSFADVVLDNRIDVMQYLNKFMPLFESMNKNSANTPIDNVIGRYLKNGH